MSEIEENLDYEIINLDKELLRKRQFCINRIDSLKKRHSAGLKPLVEELSELRHDLDACRFEWEHIYGRSLESFGKNEQRDPNEIKKFSEIKLKINNLSLKINKINSESVYQTEIKKYEKLLEKYEERICAKAGGVLIQDIDWNKNIAKIPKGMKIDVSNEILEDLEEIENEPKVE